MNVKYALVVLAGLAMPGALAPAMAQSVGGLSPAGQTPAPPPSVPPASTAQPSSRTAPDLNPFGPPNGQLSGAQSPASQIPLSGIQPVDNQAIMNGLADATSPVGSQAHNPDSPAEKSRRAAFDSALNGLFPMRSSEINTLIDRLHENESTIADRQFGNPKAEIKAETISTDPGGEPKEIQLEVGYVTTISVLDATGNPWPIEDIGIGGNFEVPPPEEGSNVIRMTPLAKYAVGNMSMRLVGLNTPLTFKLRASTGIVYYRYDARIPKLGPKASVPLIQHGNDMVAGDTLLMNILDGSPPLSSTRLTVTGVDQRTAAWRIGNKVYLRTPLTLLSPGWEGSVASSDGTHVYLIPDTPVLLLSEDGNMVHGRIGNNAKVDEQPVPAIEDGMAHPLRPSAAALAQDESMGIYHSNDAILPSPNGSRTLIRPVPVRTTPSPTAAQAQQPAGTTGAATSTPTQGAQ